MPERALFELQGLHIEASKREPEWFNDAVNYRGATNGALEAQHQALELVANVTWAKFTHLWALPAAEMAHGSSALVFDSEQAEEVAEKMRLCAMLCAESGQHASAASLLTRAAQLKDVALAKSSGASVHASPQILASRALAQAGAPVPWPATLCSLLAGVSGTQLANVVGELDCRDRFTEGAAVLAREPRGFQMWVRGTIHKVHGEDGYDVLCGGWRLFEGLPHKHVLVVGCNGGGAMLREAAKVGNVQLAQALLDAGVSPFEADSSASTALHHAAAAGHASVCKLLVAARADCFEGNKHCHSALDLALCNHHNIGYGSARRALAPSTSDQAVATGDAVTPLMLASREGNLNLVRTLISSGTDIHATCNQAGTALAFAAEEGRLAVITELLHCGARVDAEDAKGFTPLMEACKNSQVEAVEALLSANANPNHRAKQGSGPGTLRGISPLEQAATSGSERVIHVLLRSHADPRAGEEHEWTAIMCASEHAHHCTIAILAEAAPDILDRATPRGWTALLRAACGGATESVRVLLLAHASVDHSGWPDGRTALFLACEAGHRDTVAHLLMAGANAIAALGVHPGSKVFSGYTPLLIASENGNQEVVRALLAAEVSADSERAAQGHSALMLAAQAGHLDTARTLLHGGANVNATSRSGLTALSWACGEGMADVASLLIQASADINMRCEKRAGEEVKGESLFWQGFTPLMFAARNVASACVKVLLEACACCTEVAHNGETALSLARTHQGSGRDQRAKEATIQLLEEAHERCAGPNFTDESIALGGSEG